MISGLIRGDLIIRGRLLCIFFLVCLKVEFGMHVYVTIAYIRSVFLCTQSSIFFFQIHIDGHDDMAMPSHFPDFPTFRWPKTKQDFKLLMQRNDVFIMVSNNIE